MSELKALIVSEDSWAATQIARRLVSKDDIAVNTHWIRKTEEFKHAIDEFKPNVVILDEWYWTSNPKDIDFTLLNNICVITIRAPRRFQNRATPLSIGKKVEWATSLGSILEQASLSRHVAHLAGIQIRHRSRQQIKAKNSSKMHGLKRCVSHKRRREKQRIEPMLNRSRTYY